MIYILTWENMHVERTNSTPVLVRHHTIVKAVIVRGQGNNLSAVNTTGKRVRHWKIPKREFLC